MTEAAAPPKRRTGLLIWMIVSQLLAIGSLVIWAFVAGMSVMAFDEGSSPVAWAIVLTVWAYPLFPVLMAIGAWVAFALRKNRLATVLTGLTFVPPVLLYLVLRFANLIGL
jgi:cytochrome c-type biogenesis protein CcmH/NrfF